MDIIDTQDADEEMEDCEMIYQAMDMIMDEELQVNSTNSSNIYRWSDILTY